jgi:hypothetical protein
LAALILVEYAPPPKQYYEIESGLLKVPTNTLDEQTIMKSRNFIFDRPNTSDLHSHKA